MTIKTDVKNFKEENKYKESSGYDKINSKKFATVNSKLDQEKKIESFMYT